MLLKCWMNYLCAGCLLLVQCVVMREEKLLSAVLRSHETVHDIVPAASSACPALVLCKRYASSTVRQCAERADDWAHGFRLADSATTRLHVLTTELEWSLLLAFVSLSSRLTLVLTSLLWSCACAVCMASLKVPAASGWSVAAPCTARGLGSGLAAC